ncbi:MAG: formylglycine-generating enzyme family protein [candidate division WOR-3 bacterium]|nr:formylglycine-generating enzyme family protein [candidate division WOR-3 bacterium]
MQVKFSLINKVIVKIILSIILFSDSSLGSSEDSLGQLRFDFLGLECRIISKEEILSMKQINGKYHTIYYQPEREDEAQKINSILEKGDSIILEITGLEELVKFNVVLPLTKGLYYTDLPYTMIIPDDDPIFLFSVFHEQFEITLQLKFNLYQDPQNRFVGDGLANYLMWTIMAQFWPEIFYKYSQDISDIFTNSTKIYDLSLWKLDTSEIESEFSSHCYYVAPYFWAKIITKSKQSELIKTFIAKLKTSAKLSFNEIIKILRQLTKLDISQEMKISASEITKEITKYWLFFNVPTDMTVIYGPVNDSIIFDENYHRKFVINYYYLIDKYEVSNEQFCKFLNACGNQQQGGAYWIELDSYPEIQKLKERYFVKSGREKYPVRWVTWYGAQAYAKWSGKRLPTEAEWKKAGQGRIGAKYPWQRKAEDNGWDSTLCNWQEYGIYDGHEHTAPVDSFAKGKSSYGCYNMVGNVFEWVWDWAKPLEQLTTINPIGDTGVYKIQLGGSFNSNKQWQTTYSRLLRLPNSSYSDVGFRCAKDLPQLKVLPNLKGK